MDKEEELDVTPFFKTLIKSTAYHLAKHTAVVLLAMVCVGVGAFLAFNYIEERKEEKSDG